MVSGYYPDTSRILAKPTYILDIAPVSNGFQHRTLCLIGLECFIRCNPEISEIEYPDAILPVRIVRKSVSSGEFRILPGLVSAHHCSTVSSTIVSTRVVQTRREE